MAAYFGLRIFMEGEIDFKGKEIWVSDLNFESSMIRGNWICIVSSVRDSYSLIFYVDIRYQSKLN